MGPTQEPAPVAPPQPPMQPVQPMQPAPQPMQQPTQPQFFNNAPMPGQMVYAQPPKKSKKGLIIGLIVGGVVLLAAIAGIVIWLMMSTVSKADYQKAADAYNELNIESGGVATSTGSLSSLDADDISAKIDAFESKFNAMKDLKAMNDSEVKAAYNKMVDPVKKVITTSRALVPFIKAAKDSCGSSSSSSTCTTALKSAKGESSELNAMIDAMVEYYQSMSGTYSSSAYTNYSNANKTFTTALNKISTDAKDAATGFKDVINKKITK